jgi:hypothetical protein
MNIGMELVVASGNADGIIGTAKEKALELNDALVVIAGVVAVGFLLYWAFKGKFRLAPLLGAAVVAGFLVWLVNGGISTPKGLIENEFSAPATTVGQAVEVPPAA